MSLNYWLSIVCEGKVMQVEVEFKAQNLKIWILTMIRYPIVCIAELYCALCDHYSVIYSNTSVLLDGRVSCWIEQMASFVLQPLLSHTSMLNLNVIFILVLFHSILVAEPRFRNFICQNDMQIPILWYSNNKDSCTLHRCIMVHPMEVF